MKWPGNRRYSRALIIIVAFSFALWYSLQLWWEILPRYEAWRLVENYKESEQDHFSEWVGWDNDYGSPTPIIPNVVHFIKFRKHEMSFGELVVFLSAWCNQKPDRLVIHCDCQNLTGRYWDMVKLLPGVEVRKMAEPTAVFGQLLSEEYRVYHAGDVARIAILREFGGIALDFDTYVIKNLNEYRRYECTVAWPEGISLGCQVIIAHRNSRFMHLYQQSYRYYKSSQWYYNAGKLPTAILEQQPHLVHREAKKFGVHPDLKHLLFKGQWSEWRTYSALHLLIRHHDGSEEFNEYNIRTYPHAFGEMARLVLYGSTNMIHDNRTIDMDFQHCRT